MKTVLQITTTYNASPGKIMYDIQKYGEKKGYRMIGAYGRGKKPNDIQAIKIGNKLSVLIHVFNTRIFDKHGLSSKRATKNLIKEIELINPAIIHLHNIHGYYLNVEILFEYIKQKDIKVVWTLHDAWPISGHGAYPAEISFLSKGKKDYPKSFLFNKYYDNKNIKKEIFTGVKNMRIITPSSWLKDIIRKSFLNEYRIDVINNGIDLDLFKPRYSDFRTVNGLENKRLYLGVANVWDQKKGLDIFIKLSEKLNKHEKIILVGLDQKQVNKMPENIIPIKKTRDIKELTEIYSTSDVFVNPTMEDNYPTVNLEAIACGLPVVTYNVGGSPESARKGNHIVIEERGNIEKLYQAISQIEKKETKLKQGLSKEKMAEKYISLYKEITEV